MADWASAIGTAGWTPARAQPATPSTAHASTGATANRIVVMAGRYPVTARPRSRLRRAVLRRCKSARQPQQQRIPQRRGADGGRAKQQHWAARAPPGVRKLRHQAQEVTARPTSSVTAVTLAGHEGTTHRAKACDTRGRRGGLPDDVVQQRRQQDRGEHGEQDHQQASGGTTDGTDVHVWYLTPSARDVTLRRFGAIADLVHRYTAFLSDRRGDVPGRRLDRLGRLSSRFAQVAGNV